MPALVLCLLDWSTTRVLQPHHTSHQPQNVRNVFLSATGRSIFSRVGKWHVCRSKLVRALCITFMTTFLAEVALWLRKETRFRADYETLVLNEA